ncbi:DUF3376 domain-containing protein [Gordonia sp. DT219]|uniref:DUF3376 domain-containing protein n=1 Tax=Gordonia sp. DT219 TaxID=3416658 RepID=UPI003CFA7EC5
MAPDVSGNQAPKRTLRVALAMRGGVSMAVWIGGVIAELDLLRRAADLGATDPGNADPGDSDSRRAAIYRELLAGTEYSDVEFDILAGASAGGLNAVLFALAQSYGVVTDSIVRTTWERDGGLWDLLRTPDPDHESDDHQRSGFSAVDSVLSGDGRFLTLARNAVDEIAASDRTSPGSPPQSLSVELAATLLPDPDKQVTTAQGGFSFSRRPGGLRSAYTTIPGRGDHDGAGRTARARMALAIRSTSSFPGAFEPSTVYSCADPASPSTDTHPDMHRVFPFARGTETTCGDPFLVIDGGVFDNIPIDRAIRAIQRAPASQPTERVLVYLDPQPPAQPDPIPRQPSDERAKARKLTKQTAQLTRWTNVIRTGMAMKRREESAEDEIAIIRAHNESVLELRGRADALAAWLSSAAALPCVGIDRYIQCRTGSDAEHFGQVLTAPHTMLFNPPFGAQPHTPVEPLVSIGIKAAIDQAYRAITPRPPGSAPVADGSPEMLAQAAMTCGDATAALDATQFLISWTRTLEAAGVTTLGEVKRCLYRCGAVLLQARHLTVDTGLAAAAGRPEDSAAGRPEDWATALVDGTAAQWQLRITDCVNQSLAVGNSLDDAQFYETLSPGRATASAVGETAGDGVGAETGDRTIGLLPAIWTHLDEHLTCLVAARQTPGSCPEGDQQAWNESLYFGLHQHLSRSASHSAYDIVRLVTASGVPGSQSNIRFYQITGDESPAIGDGYTAELRDTAIATQLQDWLTHDTAIDLIDPDQLSAWMSRVERLGRAEDKLCGTPLARFGGFLDWRWRASDWRWGRMDAASGIVKLLSDRESRADAADVPAEQIAEKIRGLQQLIADEDADAHAVPVHGLGALTALGPSYRVGLVSRTSSLVVRALQPASIHPSPVKKSALIVGVALLRVIPVLLGLIADPVRLLTALAATLLASLVLPGDSGTGPVPWYTFAGIMMALGVVLLIRAWAARSKWRAFKRRFCDAVAAAQQETGPRPAQLPDWSAHVDAAGDRSSRRCRAAAGFGGICVAAGVIGTILTHARLLTRFQIEPMLICFALVVGVALTLALACTKVVPTRRDTGHGHSVWARIAPHATAATAVAIAFVAAIIVLAFWDDPAPSTGLTYTGAVAAVLTAVLVVCSLGGWSSAVQIGIHAPAAAVVAGALSAVVDNYVGGDWAQALTVLVPVAVWWLYLAVFLGNVTPRSSKAMGLLPPEATRGSVVPRVESRGDIGREATGGDRAPR